VLATFERAPELIDVLALHLLDRHFAPGLNEEMLKPVAFQPGTAESLKCRTRRHIAVCVRWIAASSPRGPVGERKRLPEFATKEELSARMRRIRKTDTKPEMVVRRLTHAMGYRHRLHRRDLPGTPDLIFPGLRKVVFVHGCFWHQHDCPLGAKQPSANPDYWLPKLARNVQRDRQNRAALAEMGWDVLVVWECETRSPAHLRRVIDRFLTSSATRPL
jgi:DNA mismatch endonuclease (patch repair protein)